MNRIVLPIYKVNPTLTPGHHHYNLSKSGSGLPYRRMWVCLADMYPVTLMSYDLIHITLMPGERKSDILDWLWKRGFPSRSTTETLVRPGQYRIKRERYHSGLVIFTQDHGLPWGWLLIQAIQLWGVGGGRMRDDRLTSCSLCSFLEITL